MSIWICSRSGFAITLALALSACSGGEGLGFLGGSDEAAEAAETRPNVALLSAQMGRGAITLTPPDGFCIDKRELRQDFAVLARCDSLGGRGGAQDAPLGLITVAVAEKVDALDTQSAAPSLAPEGSAVLSSDTIDGLAVLHLSGDTPDGTDDKHWRGLVQIGGQVLSLGAYGPDGGRLAESDGGALLAVLAQRTHDASVAAAVARDPVATGETERRGGLLSGLFDRKT